MGHVAQFAKARQGHAARHADRATLAEALQSSRADTLATFEVYRQALGPALTVPYRTELNPPLWELGHIGWFQEFWIARNPQRDLGADADPDAVRPDSLRPGGDALYNSSRVAHATRWQLPLPDADTTRTDLQAQLEQTLAELQRAADDDRGLYFHRLALFHEDMHHEAALYMARGLGIAIVDPRWQPPTLEGGRNSLGLPAARWRMAPEAGGFHFDNEAPGLELQLGACRIDSRVLSWAEYLPFVEAGGYRDLRLWSEAGRRWLANARPESPLHLLNDAGGWWQQRGRDRQRLNLAQAAEHLTLHEAQAWCNWAGRRLPTEAEWEQAALGGDPAFDWGQVWEWTASAFEPFPGFVAHPYRDYSRPWFDGRPVLRGASYLTQPRMRHPRYRNYFGAERRDIVAGFRTCALDA